MNKFLTGEMMNQFRQPLLTIIIIFATAYILSLIGCVPSGDKAGDAPAAPRVQLDSTPATGEMTKPNEIKFVLVDPSKMKECKDSEFKTLQIWDSALAAADAAINAMGEKSSAWRKNDDVVKLAQKVMVQCDQLQTYHSQNPCKKVVDKNIVNPAGTVKAYDAFRIHQLCELSNKYLAQFDALLVASAKPPTSSQPPVVAIQPPVTVVPVTGTGNNVDARDMHECSEVEFTKLNSWRAALNQAQKSIAALGPQNSWKYNSNAVDFSNLATKMCENLIEYHQDQPCKRFVKDDRSGVTSTKIYSGELLRQQCATTRIYRYEFAQQDTSLILPKARLYFDTSVISGKLINPGYASNVTYGQCIVSNTSNNQITYNSQKALVTEARVYPKNGVEGFQMFVLVTAEGIKLECYGLDYQSDQTSKNEVVRLLNQKQTNISLSYELN